MVNIVSNRIESNRIESNRIESYRGPCIENHIESRHWRIATALFGVHGDLLSGNVCLLTHGSFKCAASCVSIQFLPSLDLFKVLPP